MGKCTIMHEYLYFSLQFSFIFLEIFKWIPWELQFSKRVKLILISSLPGPWLLELHESSVCPHVSVWKHTCPRVLFVWQHRGIYYTEREACMQRKRDISIYFLPVACEQSPQAVTWPPCKERRGVIGKRGSILCGRGCWGYSWWLLFVHIFINTIKNIL